MASFTQHILNFIFPITCAGCGKDLPADDEFRVCPACLHSIRLIEGLFCQTCGAPLPDGGAHCYPCRKNPHRHFDCVRSAAAYEGTLKDLIRRFKYENRDYLDRFLGRLLVAALHAHPRLAETDCVVPVPLHWLKRMARGYNQSELLASRVSAYLQKPLAARALMKRKWTGSQMRLNREQRLKNLASCFSVPRPELVRGKAVLLVDDVCTTSSTMEACAKALRSAGATSVRGLTVAHD